MLRGHLREGRAWLRRLIANGEAINPALRAAAENAAGILAWKSGWLEEAEAHFEQALARWESEALFEAGAGTLNNLGIVAVEQRRHDAAHDYYCRSLAIYRSLDARARVAAVLSNLGSNELLAGRPEEARAPLLESLAMQRALGEQSNCANTLHNLAEMHLLLGDSAEARRIFAESIAIRSRLGSRDNLFESFSTLARIALAEERAARCAILWSAAASAIEELGQHLTAAAGAEMERETAQLRAALGPARFAELASAGRGLQLGDVLDEDGPWSSTIEDRENSRTFS
jgi:Tfp pilus assembly protein PilF